MKKKITIVTNKIENKLQGKFPKTVEEILGKPSLAILPNKEFNNNGGFYVHNKQALNRRISLCLWEADITQMTRKIFCLYNNQEIVTHISQNCPGLSLAFEAISKLLTAKTKENFCKK